jgi:hypothetical protein
MNPRQLLRLSRIARRGGGSMTQLKLMLVVALLCFAVVGVEKLFGFPDWLRPERAGGTPVITK